MSDERPIEPSGGLHPRITVVRADGTQREALLSSLAVMRPGLVDLEIRPVVVRLDDIAAQAAALAADRAGERRTARRRLEQELRAALVARDAAAEERDALIGRGQRLDEDRRWCEALSSRAADLTRAVSDAAAAADERKAEHRVAVERLERVLEQRGAAAAAMEDADRELADLEGAQLDESGIRRELEAANRFARDAAEALADAQSRLATLESQRAEAVAASEAAVAARGRAGTALETPTVDDTRVRDALEAFESSAAFGVDAGGGSALAEAIRAAEGALAQAIARAGPSPSDEVVAAAAAEVTAAQQALTELDEASRTGSLSPEARAEIEAAHEAVIGAEDRAERGLGRAAARRRLEELREDEQAVLARYGYDSHLDVVLSGGRPGGGGVRLAAEQRLQTARERYERVRAAAAGTDEVRDLRDDVRQLYGRAAALLGVDPGDRTLDLLDGHPAVPEPVVAELAAALAEVGQRPVGMSLAAAASAWLADQAEIQAARRQGREQLAALDAEIGRCTEVLERLAGAIDGTTAECERAGRELDGARRRVTTLEAELTARAGEDARRLQRMAAAEQLRSQVAALGSTLARAEAEARAGVEALAASLQAAEVAWDRAETELADAARRIVRIVEEHLEGRSPDLGTDPIAAASVVADELVEVQSRLGRSLVAAEDAVARATADADAAAMAVAEVRTDGSEPSDADRRDAVLRAVTREAPGTVIVLDDAVLGAGSAPEMLLDQLLEATADRSVVVLTEDPVVLGWAIGLPPELGTLAPAALLSGPSAASPDPRPSTHHHDHHELDHDPRAAGRPGSGRG